MCSTLKAHHVEEVFGEAGIGHASRASALLWRLPSAIAVGTAQLAQRPVDALLLEPRMIKGEVPSMSPGARTTSRP